MSSRGVRLGGDGKDGGSGTRLWWWLGGPFPLELRLSLAWPLLASPLPPGPFSLSETLQLSPFSQLILLSVGWRGDEEQRTEPRGERAWEGPSGALVPAQEDKPRLRPTFSGLFHQAAGSLPLPGEIQKDLSPPRWPQSARLRAQQTWARVRAHTRAHVSSHVCREQQVTLALLLLSQVLKQRALRRAHSRARWICQESPRPAPPHHCSRRWRGDTGSPAVKQP